MGELLALACHFVPAQALATPQRALREAADFARRDALGRAARLCDAAGWTDGGPTADTIREAIEFETEAGEAAVSYHRSASDGEMAAKICEIVIGPEHMMSPAECEATVKRRFPSRDWITLVCSGDTKQGYWEWALREAEARTHAELFELVSQPVPL